MTEITDRHNFVTDKKYQMNSLLKRQLDFFCNNAYHDFDNIIIIDGEIEGSGKSTLAQQCSYYTSWVFKKPFNIDHVVFTPKQFTTAVMSAERFQGIVWDEAYRGTSKFQIMSKVNQTIKSMLQQIRQKNLFIYVVIPYYFDLDKYIAIPRSWALLHVYLKTVFEDDPEADIDPLNFETPMLQRGFFRFYSRKNKKILYLRGGKEYNYSVAKGNFIGLFPKYYTVSEEDYKAKKAQIEAEDDGMSDSDFVKECLRREMPVPSFQNYVSYADKYIYEIRRKLNA